MYLFAPWVYGSMVQVRPEEGIIPTPGNGVTDGYVSSYGGWQLNLGLLQELQVLLMDQPTLQSPSILFSGLLKEGGSFQSKRII